MAELEATFNKNIRPLLDAVDKLRKLKVTGEGIPLPTIVVVGDQSSGKSSVLESLAGISLPRGQGISTRVPLELRLQSCEPGESSIRIAYGDLDFEIEENEIKGEVDQATNILAGKSKGVKDTPITLHIRKPKAPDLTMIDLPGITRVPVHGQPENIYEQIAGMIRRYLIPKETVILNVLSATVDFATCESIRMSQQEDKIGERTLAVVTKVDRAPEGVYEKVTADDVHIGLGYICVRNRTDEEDSHDEAREKEMNLFKTDASLSQLNKASVGISALAERLTQIQANIIRLSLPGIEKQIDKNLALRRQELRALTKDFPAEGDPTHAFLQIIDDNRNLMQDLMLYANYEQYIDEKSMHYPARLNEMFQKFSDDMHGQLKDILLQSKTEEILNRVAEARGVSLPNFLSSVVMKVLVNEEIGKVSESCTNLVVVTHEYALSFVLHIIEKSTLAFPNLQVAYKQMATDCVASCEDNCMKFVKRVLEKERSSVFTLNDYYMANVRKIQDTLKKMTSSNELRHYSGLEVEGFQDPIHLGETYNKSNDYQAAWDMKVNLAAYWKVVHKRMSDEIALEVRYSLECALMNDIRHGIVKSTMEKGKAMAHLMEEDVSTLQKKAALRKRVKILQECKAVVKKL